MAIQILLYFIFIISEVQVAKACQTGWFGSSCQYKCHCVNNQCGLDGKCTGESTCDRGWFGPLCQYQDLAQLNTATTHAALIDGNDATCASVSTFNLTWNITYQVTWFRIIMQQPNSLQNVQLTLNKTITPTTYLIKVTDRVTDILCQTDLLATHVSLHFGSTLAVCSVYLSGGRNVALKQTTSQSSDYEEKDIVRNSSLAVDGNTSGNFSHITCTHTAESKPGEWRVTFSITPNVNRYILYNRDSDRQRLQGFLLNSYSNAGSKLFEYRDTSSNNNVPIYTITTGLHGPVSYVNISVGGILTLCEVEIYGESVCNVKNYGPECTKTCNCNDPTETCFVATGGCLSGCAAGYQGEDCWEPCNVTFFGQNCESRCSINCLLQHCNNVNGFCDACVPGKQGALCDKDCNPTYYGTNCSTKCSSNCLDSLCHNVNGACISCVDGKQGTFCEQKCSNTYYGKNCTQKCSTSCLRELCDNVNGFCHSCIPGKQGVFCERDCNATYYGTNCSDKCSSDCLDSLCDNVNGTCKTCVDGKQGPFCEEKCNETYFGTNCSKKCSSNCLDRLCDNVNGSCHSCVAGRKGPFCNESCDSHNYGPNCDAHCSTNCNDSICNSTNGHCWRCYPGFQGYFCNEDCEKSFFGQDCNQTCDYCLNADCNNTNGVCFKCAAGSWGDFCQACPNQTFGESCKENCSKNCEQDGTCHPVNGTCKHGCRQGYRGETCAQKIPEEQSPIAAIVAPVVVIVLLAILAVIGFVYWRHRRLKNKEDHVNDSQRNELFDMSDSPTSSGKLNTIKGTDKPVAIINAYSNVDVEADRRYIKVSKLDEFMQAHGRDYFVDEFKRIPTPQNVTTMVGLSEANKHKSRYRNICTYDHSRVHLEINASKNEGDFINASYVESYNNQEKYIASQGPNEVIINDFVRMLWEQKVEKVVMLTNLIEEGKVKCVSYWPEEGTTTFGDIKVKLAATHVFADYTIRKLELIKKDHPTHLFTQFHFTSWPDKGVPLTPWGLVDFEQRVALGGTSRPIVVHCSAGVGRTGTFIALRNVMREAEDTGYINCFNTVAKLRQDRVLMVQTAEQYEFLHKAAQVAITCMGTTVHANDIVSRIQFLGERSLSGVTNMEKEFQAVVKLSEDLNKQTQDEDISGENGNIYQNHDPVVEKKNRRSSIIAGNLYRAVLSCESNNLEDYVNAVLVSSFTKRDNQILTQLPMPNTVTDFWRLVAQYNVSLILAFNKGSSEKDETLGQYLPANMTTPLDCGPYEIHTGPVKSESLWEEQQITIKTVKKAITFLPVNVTTESHVTHIASKSTDLNPKNLLKLVKHTRSNNVQAQGRVLYMCRNGAEYSGLACVLSLLLDRMDHDQSLTVPLVVGAIKCIRSQVIPSMDQYRCLYQVLQRYNELNTPYSNYDNVSDLKANRGATHGNDTFAEENVYQNN
ncbi:uncharacterized protein LOC131953936 [Physella acuta]|uniref:uncharacterized protein LOC131953936 n=1 Tax=Physella acuta TaxID=109671 RepID=UPI0027DAC61A|nr:uncharacterized protein LOC131953936 [Physella acuta]